MAEIITSIEIDAPPERVWQVLSDTRAYDEWNPFVTRVSTRLESGEPIRFMAPLGTRDIRIDARLLRVDPPREIRWRGPRSTVLAKLFAAEHYLKVEPIGTDRTRFVHGETFSGIVVSMFWSKLEPKLRPLYVAMNEALKRRAEAS